MPSMGAAGEGGQSDVGHYFLLLFAPWMATTEKTERPFYLSWVLPSLQEEKTGRKFSLGWPSAYVDWRLVEPPRPPPPALPHLVLALGGGKEPLVQLSADSGLPSMPLGHALCLII